MQVVYIRNRPVTKKLLGTEAKDGSTVRYVGTVRYASIFAKKYGTLVQNAFSVMVRVWYVGTVRLFRKGTDTVLVRWYAL